MALNDKANAAVHAALEAAIAEKGEIGIQVAAYLGGELVIDTWAGLANPDTGEPVTGDTLFNVFSVTKAVPATAIHIQAERGLLDYDAPIARYWPEWGCNGKEDVTVRDALTHHTGTPQMPADATLETVCDWDATVAGIAALAPVLPVRTTPGYQSMSFGWILGEIVRRTDPQHRDFSRFVREEIAEPFGIADLWIGIPDEVEHRIAKLTDTEPPAPPPDPQSLFARSLPYHLRLKPEVFELPAIRRAAIPGVGGIFTARSEARFWAILANGGELDGKRLLSRQRIDDACRPRAGTTPDPVYFNLVMPLSEGGYWMHSDTVPFTCPARGPRTICVPGAGGSLGWADPDTGLAVAFCHNRMLRPKTCDEHPLTGIARVIRTSLGLAN
jgi:CubicO group peptidase (beta-lactamase class C family)